MTRRFRKVFLCWFLVLLLFFAAANLAGYVRPRGLKPIGWAGFPFTFAFWGFDVEGWFDWPALALDISIAVAASAAVAWVCAVARCRRTRAADVTPAGPE